MTSETLTLVISLALSIASVALSVLAIWLSLRFASASSAALDSVKDLAQDTRVLVEASLSQQKDFSSKMLDSLIEQGKYGRESPHANALPSAVQQLIQSRLDDTEKRVSAAVERTVTDLASTIRADSRELQHALSTIRHQISSVSDVAPDISKALSMPTAIADALQDSRGYPAILLLLAAIVQSGATSIADLTPVRDQYHLPTGWEDAIDQLIERGILTQRPGGFEVRAELRPSLEAWVRRNRVPFRKLIALYGAQPGELGVTDRERAIGRSIRF